MSKKGRGRNATPASVKDKERQDSTNNRKPESGEAESPVSWEHETEDGLKIEVDPFGAEVSREYQLTEQDLIEFAVEIDTNPIEFQVENRGLDISVSGEIGLPGNLLGVSGGITIDLSTGEITGGEIGGEIGGVGVEVSVSGENGCQKSVELSIGPFSITYGRDDCNDQEPVPPPEPVNPIDDPDIPPIDLGIRITNTPDPSIEYQCPVGVSVGTTDRPRSYPYGYDFQYSMGGYTETHTLVKRPYSEQVGPNYSASGWHNTYFAINVYGTWEYEDGRTIRFLKKRIVLTIVVFAWPGSYFGDLPYCVKSSVRQSTLPPPPPIPPIRNMDKCCSQTLALLEEIHEALNVSEILDKGIKTPNRLIAYGGKLQSTHKDYLSLMAFMIREIDHLGIHPFEVNIADSNPALEGDQSVSLEFVNATAVAKQLIELSLENKGDSAARLNLQVRSARIQVQILNAVVVISRMVQGLINYVGMPIREIVDNVTMPFDITLGNRRKFSGKGFGTGKRPDLVQEINKNTEQATEAILDKFLQEEKQPIVSETYDGSQPGLIELIQRVMNRR